MKKISFGGKGAHALASSWAKFDIITNRRYGKPFSLPLGNRWCWGHPHAHCSSFEFWVSASAWKTVRTIIRDTDSKQRSIYRLPIVSLQLDRLLLVESFVQTVWSPMIRSTCEGFYSRPVSLIACMRGLMGHLTESIAIYLRLTTKWSTSIATRRAWS